MVIRSGFSPSYHHNFSLRISNTEPRPPTLSSKAAYRKQLVSIGIQRPLPGRLSNLWVNVLSCSYQCETLENLLYRLAILRSICLAHCHFNLLNYLAISVILLVYGYSLRSCSGIGSLSMDWVTLRFLMRSLMAIHTDYGLLPLGTEVMILSSLVYTWNV